MKEDPEQLAPQNHSTSIVEDPIDVSDAGEGSTASVAPPEVPKRPFTSGHSKPLQGGNGNHFIDANTVTASLQQSQAELKYSIEHLRVPCVFKTSNRLVEDLRYNLHFLLGPDKISLLNSKTIDYSRKLASTDALPFSVSVLNNVTNYAPFYEKLESISSKKDDVHLVRCLLVDEEAAAGALSISEIKTYHLNITIKHKLNFTNPTQKQQFFLIDKSQLFDADAKDLCSLQQEDFVCDGEVTDSVRNSIYKEKADDDIATQVEAAKNATPEIIDSATYVCLDTQTLVHFEIIKPELAAADLEQFTQESIEEQNKGSKDGIPTQSECLKTLFKLLKGPLLYTDKESKAIKTSHKIINSHVKETFLTNRLFFSKCEKRQELTPINFLHYSDQLIQKSVRDWLIRVTLEVIYVGVKVNSKKPTTSCTSTHNYAKNGHFREFTFNAYIPIVYRILNEFDLSSSIKYESCYKYLSFNLSSSQLSFKNEDFINLTNFPFYGTNLIIDNYNMLKQVDPQNRPLYFQSIKNIAASQNNSYSDSSNFEMFLAKELSVGALSAEEINNAFKYLGIAKDAPFNGHINDPKFIESVLQVSDKEILDAYEHQLKEHPEKRSELKTCLKNLCSFKGSSIILEYLNSELLPLEEAYLNLGVTEIVDDDTVTIAHNIKCNDEPESKELIDKSLVSLATYRRSHVLLSYAERNCFYLFKHLLPNNGDSEPTEEKCYDFLNLDKAANDYQILSDIDALFKNQDQKIIADLRKYSIDDPHSLPALDLFKKYRLYLIRLQQFRKSNMIDYYLQKGAIHPSAIPLDHWPTGLNNIGNTCYLNSLLQFYFVITPLRNLVLDFQKTFPVNFNQEIAENERFVNRRIGGRTVKYKEVERSYQFTYNLRDLFHNMIYSTTKDLIPSKELAYLAFSPITQEVEFSSREQTAETAGLSGTIASSDSNADATMNDDDTDTKARSVSEPKTDALIDLDSPSADSDVPIDANGDNVSYKVSSSNQSKLSQTETATAAEDADTKVAHVENAGAQSEHVENDEDSEMLEISQHKSVSSPDQQAEVSGNAVSQKTVYNPTAVAKISFDQLENTLEIGRQQDVTECIENVLFQLEAALDPIKLEEDDEQYDTIKRLFYGKTKQTIAPINNPNKSRSKTERFLSLLVNIGDHPRDMYDALDGYFTEDIIQLSEDGDVKRSLMVTEMPEILQVHIQRVQYDLQRGMAFKSTQPLPFSEKLYMDRYMESDDPKMLQKRKETVELKKQATALKDRYKLITSRNANGLTIKDSLISTKNFLESQVLEENGFSIKQETIDVLGKQIDKINADVKNITQSISDLHDKIDRQFESYKKVGYDLFAIFIHRGEASYGHYWIYIRDPQKNVYRKYNDETVSEATLEEVFNFKEDNTATPYFVVYAKENNFLETVEPLKRIVN